MNTSEPVRMYRKKSIELPGLQWTGTNVDELADWCGPNFRTRPDDGSGFTAEVYDYLHDNWPALRAGDWVFRGLRGEFYPVEGSTFPLVYEPAPRDAAAAPEGTVVATYSTAYIKRAVTDELTWRGTNGGHFTDQQIQDHIDAGARVWPPER